MNAMPLKKDLMNVTLSAHSICMTKCTFYHKRALLNGTNLANVRTTTFLR